MKQVTVYSTAVSSSRTIETSAATWGELQSLLGEQGISYSGMKAVVGESQVTLESNAAILPDSNFTLFLLPQKVKSGGVFGWDEDCGCDDDDEDEEERPTTPKEKIRDRIIDIQESLDELLEMIDALDATTDPKNSALSSKAAEIQKNLGGIFG